MCENLIFAPFGKIILRLCFNTLGLISLGSLEYISVAVSHIPPSPVSCVVSLRKTIPLKLGQSTYLKGIIFIMYDFPEPAAPKMFTDVRKASAGKTLKCSPAVYFYTVQTISSPSTLLVRVSHVSNTLSLYSRTTCVLRSYELVVTTTPKKNYWI
jgi:hypothetical protein